MTVRRSAWRPERVVIVPIRGGYIVTDSYIAAKVVDLPKGFPTESGSFWRKKGEWGSRSEDVGHVVRSIDRSARGHDHLDAWPIAAPDHSGHEEERPLYTNPGENLPILWAWTNGEDLLWFDADFLDIICRLLGDKEYDWTCNGPSSPLIAWEEGVWRGMAMPVRHGFPSNGLTEGE